MVSQCGGFFISQVLLAIFASKIYHSTLGCGQDEGRCLLAPKVRFEYLCRSTPRVVAICWKVLFVGKKM